MPSPNFSDQAIAVPEPTIPCAITPETNAPVWIHDLTASRSYGEMLQLRQEDSDNLAKGQGAYYCPQCRAPLAIRINGAYHRFYFKHAQNGGLCSLETDLGEDRMSETEQMMEAVRESPLHIAMKASLARQLEADDRFKDIRIEERVTGTAAQAGHWRRPDVSANFQGTRIAFEAQLSTTPLKDMQARRRFYAEENTCLVWVMPNFNTGARVTNLDDVIVQQDFAALSMTAETVDVSLSSGRLNFTAHRWHDSGKWIVQMVDFDQITFLPHEGRVAFPIDYDAEQGPKSALAERLAQIDLDDPTEADMEAWDEFRARLRRDTGLIYKWMPTDILVTLARAVSLATTGEVIGWQVKDLHHAAAILFEKDWPSLMMFLTLLEGQGMALDETIDEPHGLRVWLEDFRAEWPGGPKSYRNSTPQDLAAIAWLFPEISEDRLREKDSGKLPPF